MIKHGRLPTIIQVFLAIIIIPVMANAAVSRYEVLGVSDDWIMVRENIPASSADTAACTYPKLDPSEYIGATVHFYPLSSEAKRGRLLLLEKPESSLTLYAPSRSGDACTSPTEANRLWSEIVARATSLGIAKSATPPAPVVVGAAVPSKSCVLLDGASVDRSTCRREFKHKLKGGPIRIGVSLIAVPEAPDEKTCQFVGHRFGVVIQVAGLDFGEMESGMAPGGFANHYDCRPQQFDPMRLYQFERFVVLVAGFSGTAIAGKGNAPFVLIVPTQPAL